VKIFRKKVKDSFGENEEVSLILQFGSAFPYAECPFYKKNRTASKKDSKVIERRGYGQQL
jgi:hypothetical protein